MPMHTYRDREKEHEYFSSTLKPIKAKILQITIFMFSNIKEKGIC